MMKGLDSVSVWIIEEIQTFGFPGIAEIDLEVATKGSQPVGKYFGSLVVAIRGFRKPGNFRDTGGDCNARFYSARGHGSLGEVKR